jgi:hypothetical protein
MLKKGHLSARKAHAWEGSHLRETRKWTHHYKTKEKEKKRLHASQGSRVKAYAHATQKYAALGTHTLHAQAVNMKSAAVRAA